MSTDTDNAPSTEAPDPEDLEQPKPEVETPAENPPEPVAEPEPEPEAPGEPASEDSPSPQVIVPSSVDELPDEIDDFEAAINQTVIEFREGDIVEGTVVSVDADGAMVDVGYKSEGLIPTEELSIRANVDPSTIVSVGDKVEALVLNKEDDEGRLILSKKRAQYERAWGKVQEVTEAGGTVKGTVIEVVKGGLIVDIGLRGFLPASLVDLRRVRDLDPFIGTEIEAKVIELDRNRNNVVLSRRAYLEEEQAEQRAAFLDDLAVGEARPGVVSSVVNFGAFVDLGGMDGLVHVSEMSWQHISHPSEMVKVGDKVNVKVLEVDRERERISLSIRQTLEDPWEVFSRAEQRRRCHRRFGDEDRAVWCVRLRLGRCRRTRACFRDRHSPRGITRVGALDQPAGACEDHGEGRRASPDQPLDQASACPSGRNGRRHHSPVPPNVRPSANSSASSVPPLPNPSRSRLTPRSRPFCRS